MVIAPALNDEDIQFLLDAIDDAQSEDFLPQRAEQDAAAAAARDDKSAVRAAPGRVKVEAGGSD